MTDISEWNAKYDAEMLDQLLERYEGGDNLALLMAIRVCARADLVMPDWVARGYNKGWDAYRRCHVKTLDEAFDVRRPKGFNRAAWEKRFKLECAVVNDASDYQERGVAVDYEAIGKKLNISESQATKYYYAAVGFYRPDVQEKHKNSAKT